MLLWTAAVLFIIAMSAGILGFTNIVGPSLSVAKLLFVVFLIPAIVLLFVGLFLVGGI